MLLWWFLHLRPINFKKSNEKKMVVPRAINERLHTAGKKKLCQWTLQA
jgi:hypothetical protein